jgi:hypothetical protein
MPLILNITQIAQSVLKSVADDDGVYEAKRASRLSKFISSQFA